ncbi:MAG: MarR family transcriptional regulator [Trebonia sp.]
MVLDHDDALIHDESADAVELAAAVHPRLVRLYTMLRRGTMDLGLSRSALSVLVLLRDRGPQRITELATAEHVAQPSMTALVSRLEERGFVRRRHDSDDGRVVLAELCEEGERTLERLVRQRVLALSKLLAALSDEERGAIARALPALDRLTEQRVERT